MNDHPGLYVHIPFCRRKCAYCDFYSLAGREDAAGAYAEALKRQMRALSDVCRGRTVDSVYIGGGTPSILPGRLLTPLLDEARACFDIASDAEITVEANPATVSASSLASYRGAGIDRISFGVQSANDRTLKKLGRLHTFEEAQESVLLASRAGFKNISVDLMYALPGESAEDLLYSLGRALELPVVHISLYGLKIEENTPFGRDPSLVLPEEDEQCAMYLESVALLEKHGFMQYEISNFARPGYESRHNLKYWTRAPYLGFGPGAHSFFGGERFSCPRDLDAYLAETDFSLSSPYYDDRHEIAGREALEEEIMLSLRTARGAPLCALERLIGKTPDAYLEALQTNGLAKIENGALILTARGMLVSNGVISDLLAMEKEAES